MRRTQGSTNAIIVLVAALAASAPARADEDACRPSHVATIATQTDIGGRPLIRVKIDGRERPFVVDTGGIYTMVTAATARELALTRDAVRPRSFIFVNGDAADTTAHTKNFAIDRLPFGAFTFLVTPDSLKLPGASGALGPDILHLFDVEFDFAQNRMRMFAHSRCGPDVVYWTTRSHSELVFTLDDSWHISATAMLDGKLVDVIIDTGAIATTMTLEDARSEYGLTPASAQMQRIDGGDDEQGAVYRHSFHALDLQGISIQAPSIVLRHDRTGIAPSGLRPELVVGMDVLAKLHLYVAYAEQKIYLTGADDR